MFLKRIGITTDSAGDFTYARVFRGTVLGIAVTVGDLETPSIAVTDGVYLTSLLNVASLAADAKYQPAVAVQDDSGGDISGAYAAPVIMGSLKVEVSGGGDTK